MSRRQPAARRQKAKSKSRRGDSETERNGAAAFSPSPRRPFSLSALCLKFHITNISRFQTLQKPHHFVVIEFRIFRFDHKKETVAGRQRKIRRVENRMVRLAACSAP